MNKEHAIVTYLSVDGDALEGATLLGNSLEIGTFLELPDISTIEGKNVRVDLSGLGLEPPCVPILEGAEGSEAVEVRIGNEAIGVRILLKDPEMMARQKCCDGKYKWGATPVSCHCCGSHGCSC